MSLPQDFQFMARALELARRGFYTTDPNPRVGCVIVLDDEIIGEGWHEVAGEPHAEVHALRMAGDKAKGATAYITLEPCSHHGKTPPCSDAIIAAGIKRVVIAMQDPNPEVSGSGIDQLAANNIQVVCGVMAAEANTLNPGFIKRMKNGLPYVHCKLAMSLDGRTAMASGESKWITGEAARKDVQELRARSSAIITGIETVLADDPSLTHRTKEWTPAYDADLGKEYLQPLRVVLDTQLRMPENSRMLSLPGNTLIITGIKDENKYSALIKSGAEVLYLPSPSGRLDLRRVMQILAQREINEVLLEAGPTLSGAMLQAGLIDQLTIYIAPILMGDGARGLFHLPGLESMDQRVNLEIIDQRMVGGDWRITARVYESLNEE